MLPVLRSIGQNPTEDEILGLVIEYDVNGDGTIDFDEFIEMMAKVHFLKLTKKILHLFVKVSNFERKGSVYKH